MSVSRRKFIKSGTFTALSAGFLFKGGEALVFAQKSSRLHTDIERRIPFAAQRNPILYYNAAAFEASVGSTFIVRDALGAPIQLELLKSTPYKPNPNIRITTGRTQETECFSLLFRAQRALPEFSDIHRMEHPVLGNFDLFLKRSGDSGEMLYEAVINHLYF
jgi:hypothetical protein